MTNQKIDELISAREYNLKKKWKGTADYIPVNASPQYNFDSAQRSEQFIRSQYPDRELREQYDYYREEWYRRPKEFDPGEAPLAVVCELVSTCNLNCNMCYVITEEFQNSVVGASRMLPWPIVKSVIDECVDIGVFSILFSWRGESTLYRGKEGERVIRFPDVLSYARERGILEVTCLTHGQQLTEEVSREIVDAEPNWISVSIDGLGEVYNKIRRPRNRRGTDYDAFKTVTENVKRLIEIRNSQGKSRPQIRSNTIFPPIATDPEAYYKYMKDIGVDWITVNELLDFRGDELPEDDILNDWACQYPFQRLTVSANGIILPCTGAHNEESGLVLGRYINTPPKTIRNMDSSIVTIDLQEMTLADAWKSPKLDKIREIHRLKMRKNIKPGCHSCRHGAKKNGVTWVPQEWNMETMEWEGGVWME